MGTPCDEIRLMEKPQVKNEPASCQNATVRMAVLTGVRVAATAAALDVGVSPSGARPIDSGDSRITMRPMSHATTGTSRLMPVMAALPRTETAVPRRLTNHRLTTAFATTGPTAD